MPLPKSEAERGEQERTWDNYWNKYEWPEHQEESTAHLQSRSPSCFRRLAESCGKLQRRRTDIAEEIKPSKYICCFKRRGHGFEQHLKKKSKAPGFHGMWDIKDPAFLDKVACDCLIKVTTVDPKNSRFELRMKCKWTFRTDHQNERTETKLRRPGLRLPGLIVTVDESRIWKDLSDKDSSNTVLWRGISRFTISGFERFEMHDFPFDRQIVNLDTFDFVWNSNTVEGDFDFSMNLCSFHVKCVSLLPEWDPYSPIVNAIREHNPANESDYKVRAVEQAPPYANRFTVKLRLERANWYYVAQVFGLTVMITVASFLGILIPLEENLPDRLSLFAGGILTLTSFKYSVGDQLPSVPYSTNFDWCILFQFLTLIFCALETLLAFRLIQDGYIETEDGKQKLKEAETYFFFALLIVWMIYWLWIAGRDLGLGFGLWPHDWLYILVNQEYQAEEDEIEDLCQKKNKSKIAELSEELAELFKQINATRKKIADLSEQKRSPDDIHRVRLHLDLLIAERMEKEADLNKLVHDVPINMGSPDKAASSPLMNN